MRDTPVSMAIGATGVVHLADAGNHCIRVVGGHGTVTTLGLAG